MSEPSLARVAAARGATLFALGMVTGLWSAAALTGKVTVGIPHLALAAHLNALFGGLWLVALSFTLPMLSYGEVAKKRLVLGTTIPAYSNWLVTLVASFLGVRGLDYTGDHANDAVAFFLQALVVLPSLGATAAWAWGFQRPVKL
jgi:(hydroxyamino)benzene mutase